MLEIRPLVRLTMSCRVLLGVTDNDVCDDYICKRALTLCWVLWGVPKSTGDAERFHFSGGYAAFEKGGDAPWHLCPGFFVVAGTALLDSCHPCECDITTVAEPRICQMFPLQTVFPSMADWTVTLQCRGSKTQASQCSENKNKSIRTLQVQVCINSLCTLEWATIVKNVGIWGEKSQTRN